jgi:sulfite exporter TauE/SafE
MELLIAAFSLGVLGSFHCVGMCGPIALSLPVYHLSFQGRATGILLYNVGRALTYSILGGFLGALGMGVIIAGYQQALSISLGILLLLSASIPFLKNKGFFNVSFPRIAHWLKARFSYLLKKKSFAALFAIGIINGLLPCGLVYMALAGATATGDIVLGALFMAVFGLGTLPAMFGVTLFSSLSLTFRKRMQNLAPVLAGLMACLLILRGLGLGIPYVSPKLSHSNNSEHSCCQKPESDYKH